MTTVFSGAASIGGEGDSGDECILKRAFSDLELNQEDTQACAEWLDSTSCWHWERSRGLSESRLGFEICLIWSITTEWYLPIYLNYYTGAQEMTLQCQENIDLL